MLLALFSLNVTVDLQWPILSKIIIFYTKFKTSTLSEFPPKKYFKNMKRTSENKIQRRKKHSAENLDRNQALTSPSYEASKDRDDILEVNGPRLNGEMRK